MRQYIKKLQSKHEDTRKLIFTGTMIVAMSFVGLVWFYSLGDKFDTKTVEQTREDIKPFKLFSNTISDTLKNVSASVGRISNTNVDKTESTDKQIDLIPIEYTN